MGSSQITLVNTLTATHVEQLHELFQHACWTQRRTIEDVQTMIRGSDNLLGLVTSDTDTLVGFARVLTDRIYKATVFDLVVKESYRNAGLGKVPMDAITTYPQLSPIQQIELYCTEEMIPFYEQWRFSRDLGDLHLLRWSKT